MAVERNLATARVRIIADARDLAKDTQKVLEESLGDSGDKAGTNFGRRMKKQVDDAAADAGQKSGRKLADKFGETLNRRLRALSLDEIDIQASPKDALDAVERVEERLRRLSRDAATVEIHVRSEEATAELERFKKKLSHVGDDEGGTASRGFFAKFFAEGEKSLGTSFSKAFRGGLTSPAVLTAIAATAVVLAPLIGGIVAGAVVGAVGLGGVIGGIALAARDPAIKGWAIRIGNTFMAAIGQASGVFKGPLLQSLGLVEAAATRAAKSIGQIFVNTAPSVNGLTQSLIRAGDALLNSFVVATGRAGPAIKAIGSLAENVSGAFADMITTLSRDSEAGASSLDDLSDALVKVIETTTVTIDWLAKFKGALDEGDKAIDKARYYLEDHSFTLDLTADGYKKGSAEAEAYRRKTLGVATAEDELLLSGRKALTATNALQAEQSEARFTAETLKAAQEAVKTAQDRLARSLETLGGATSAQARRSDALRTAMDNLYSATRRNADANQAYEQTWDDLSGAVKDNGKSLDVHTQKGRDNRTALINLATANGELYLANIKAGDSVDSARKKHEARTEAIRKEADKLGLNKTETQKLIDVYNKIPPAKTTKLVLSGVAAVTTALNGLYVQQRALATGQSTSAVASALRKQSAPAFAGGGQVGGWSPSSTADNIHALLTAKEWVHPVAAVDYYGPQIMDAIQHRKVPRAVLAELASGELGKAGDMPVFATGGQVAPVDTSKVWPFIVDASHTKIPSLADVLSKVPIGSGPGGAFVRAQNGKPYVWASAGPHGYDCSGIVSAVYNVLHGRNPYSHTFSTGSLPGKWFTKPGVGGPLTAAWSNPGQSPASSTTGHMMGMVGGLTFESSGSRGVHLGASTRRLTDFAHIAHYNRGGYVLPSYDMGGTWRDGTIGINTSGRDEHVTSANDRDDLVALVGELVALTRTLAQEVGDTLGAVLLGQQRATRTAARQIGRRAHA